MGKRTKQSHQATTILRAALLLFVCLDVLLLGIGVALHPAAVSDGLLPALCIQGIYAGSVWFGLRGSREVIDARAGLVFGTLIAIVFVGEIILELLITIADNTPLATIEFGTVFALLFMAGLYTTWRSGNWRSAILGTVWAALFGSLLWYAAVLLTYYLFPNTPHQQQAFRAEGTFDDFKQSGMADFEAFILQDFWGAGFFHLLLAPLFALILGGAGAGVAQIGRRLQRAFIVQKWPKNS